MSDGSEDRAQLSAVKRALLEKRLRGQLVQKVSGPDIARRGSDEQLPLSYAQQRLWFLDQILPGNPRYNIPGAMRLTGVLDTTALERALNALVTRHESLRTTFDAAHGQPRPVIAPELALPVPIVSLEAWPPSEREAEMERHIDAQVHQAFNLQRGPLLRATLLKLDAENHILLLIFHHIICDGWSLGIFMREMSTLYAAFSEGKPSPLGDLPIQYADYAIWQRDWLQGERVEQQVAYWKEHLAEAPVLLRLPGDHARPAVQTFSGAQQFFRLDRELTEGLRQLSREAGVTLFMTLLAAYSVLLARYSGQTDLVVGTPVANRPRVELEGLIGFFVNTLALRLDLSGDPSFRDLLVRTRKVALGAYANQDVPYERLVEELQPERSLSYNPLFQVMFVLHNTPQEPFELPGLTIEEVRAESGTSKFDLLLALSDLPEGLSGSLEYSTDIFQRATIERMLEHFSILLQGIVNAPDQSVAALPLITGEERAHLLASSVSRGPEPAPTDFLHTLFARQVPQRPEQDAIVSSTRVLTYDELYRRANLLARQLRDLNVQRNTVVAITMDKGWEQAVAVMGVVTSGAAYLPIDPKLPDERRWYLMQDGQVNIVLTQPWLDERLSWPEGIHRIQICADEEPEQDVLPLEPVQDPDDLAYVLFTSGSTGTPKGVMIHHRGAVNTIRDLNQRFGVGPEDRVLALSSLNFDPSVYDIFGILAAGGTVVIPDADLLRDPAHWLDMMERERITLWDSVPAFMQMLVEYVGERHESVPPYLRLAILTGDRIPVPLPDQMRVLYPDLRIFNLGGAAEASIWSIYYEIESVDPEWGSIPYGRALTNQSFYVLDELLELCPTMITGELYIGGMGVGIGYWRDEEKTAARFFTHPYTGERLYRTGDLGRYLPDGNIELLGRIDFQIKLRGFRIEPGEIETTLSRCPGVHDAIVVVQDYQAGDKRLVAYVVPDPDAGLNDSGLRHFLHSRLPEYMVPSSFVLMDTLPLNPNGKVNHQQLPIPKQTHSDSNGSQPPRDAVELQLKQIWEEVLGIEHVGLRDNFFTLGGHSLLAVRLMSRIEQWCGKVLPLAALFQAPTVEKLAEVLRQQGGSVLWSPLVGIQTDGTRPPFFCIHPAGGNVLCYVDLAKELGPDQPFYGLQARGLDHQEAPHQSIPDMAGDYLKAVRTVQAHGPYLLGGWSLGGVVACEMARQLADQGEEVSLIAMVDTLAPDGTDFSDVESDEEVLTNFFGSALPISLDDLRHLDSDQRMTVVFEHAKAASLIPADIDISQARHLLAVHKSHLRALSAYDPVPVETPLVLFLASERVGVAPIGEKTGWERLAGGGITIRRLPGTHRSIVEPPHVQLLASELRDCLDRAIAEAKA